MNCGHKVYASAAMYTLAAFLVLLALLVVWLM